MAGMMAQLMLVKESSKMMRQAGVLVRHSYTQNSALVNSRLFIGLPKVCAYSSNSSEKQDFEPQIQENLQKFREGSYEKVSNPEGLKHFRKKVTAPGTNEQPGDHTEPMMGAHALPHPIWSEEELHNVIITHRKPKGIVDHIAYMGVKFTRGCYDFISGYSRGKHDEKMWLSRLCFLEAVAGVPGMVAAMVRHLDSLRKMRRDHGWIHTLLEEAENERMHLMVMLELKQPSTSFRLGVMLTQGVFVSGFSLAYLLTPKLCHRFVGYLEEEAVITYTRLLEAIDSGNMQHWNSLPGTDVAINYWKLGPEATMRDVILAIRADEAHHRVVNHTLGSLKNDDYNPYKPGE